MEESRVQFQRMQRMLHPKRIAVAGYSSRPEAWSHLLIRSLLAGGFSGELVALRPRSAPDSLASIDSLEGQEIDLLVIALPADAVPAVVEEAAGADVGGCLIFSAGFAEEGLEGAKLQQQLIDAAKGMPVIGPNSIGMISGPSRMVATASPFGHRNWISNAPTAVVSQSGAVGFVLSEELKRHGIVPRYYTSVGNEAVVSAIDLAAIHLEEPGIQSIGLYLESITEPLALQRLGELARDRGATVTILTSGTSTAGKRAAQSHTAAVVGDRLLLSALCDDAGIVITRDEQEFAAALATRARGAEFSVRPERVAVLSMSGGAGAILADRLSDAQIAVPEFSAQLFDAVSKDFDFVASPQNPVDLGGMFLRHLDKIGELAERIAESGEVDALVLFLTNGQFHLDEYRRLGEQLRELSVPAWFVWSGAQAGDLEQSSLEGIVLPSISSLRQGFETLVSKSGNAFQGASLVKPLPAETLELWSEIETRVLTESSARRVLESLSAPYAETQDISVEEALRGELRLPKFPVVLKGDTSQVPHRAQAGLIRLNIRSSEELQTALRELVARIDSLEIPRDSARVLIQHQRTSIGEFSLGLIRDELYGDFAVVGPGGADVERIDLHRYAVPLPLTDARLTRLHQHARNIAGVEVQFDSFLEVAGALGALVDLPSPVTDADLNPVLVTEENTLVLVDSLIVVDRVTNLTPKEER